jgi:molecular chaperone HtpG
MNAPIKTIHMSVEGTVDFKALLFIPETVPFNYYSKQYEKGLKLYTNGVMIMEKCGDLLPDYFSFVKGLVDSEVTLNISRETVQQTRQLKAIATQIEKKIKSELLEMMKSSREDYEEFFKEFGLQLKFGIYSSWGMNKDLLQDLLLYKSVKEDKYVSLKEYIENAKEGQDSIYYASGKSVQGIKALPKAEKILEGGYDILLMTDEVDEFVLKFLQEYDKKSFKNINTESDSEEQTLSTEEENVLKAIKERLGDKVVKVKGTTSLTKHPVCLSSEGEVSLEMEKVLSSMPGAENNVKAQRVLEINVSHSIFTKLKELYIEDIERFNKIADLLYREACLIAGFTVEDISSTTDIIFELLSK